MFASAAAKLVALVPADKGPDTDRAEPPVLDGMRRCVCGASMAAMCVKLWCDCSGGRAMGAESGWERPADVDGLKGCEVGM